MVLLKGAVCGEEVFGGEGVQSTPPPGLPLLQQPETPAVERWDGGPPGPLLHQQLQGVKRCPHPGGLQELFWDVGFPEVRPQAGVPNRTFPKIAGQGGGWWRLRPGLGSSCALWLTKCSGGSLPAKPRVTEVTSMCLLPRGRQTTALCNFGGCAVRAQPKAKTP